MIAEHDEMIGELLAELDALGIAEDTYIILTSDHGEMNMEHEQFYKMNLYEPSARIPMIIKGPDIIKGAVQRKFASLIDIYPTICDMAGGLANSDIDGLSLLPLLKGEGSFDRDFVFGEYHDSTLNTSAFMIRRGDYKYITYPGYKPMLFDLANDKWEVHNLASELTELVSEMDSLMRSVCDYEKVADEVKAYDRLSFAEWREQQLADGTYYDLMSLVFSGWDGLSLNDQKPAKRWSEDDEKAITKWLGKN
jgi:choline-sulfatase